MLKEYVFKDISLRRLLNIFRCVHGAVGARVCGADRRPDGGGASTSGTTGKERQRAGSPGRLDPRQVPDSRETEDEADGGAEPAHPRHRPGTCGLVLQTERSGGASYRAKVLKPLVFAPAPPEFLCKVIHCFKK